MGIVLSCRRIAMKRHPKVLQVVKPDGKILEYGTATLVKDIPKNIAVSGIGLLKGSSRRLPPEYEMKIGEVYHVLTPQEQPDGAEAPEERVRRIKVVITKKQLQLLLDQQVSVDTVIALLDSKKTTCRRGSGDGSALTWRPTLETIAEGID